MPMISNYVRMWPREIFDRLEPDVESTRKKKKVLAGSIQTLQKGGVYVLYRDDEPYYVGKADHLYRRVWSHANQPSGRHYHFWNFFSAFVIPVRAQRNEIEGMLIAAMPTANSANPKLKRESMPSPVRALLREMRRSKVMTTQAVPALVTRVRRRGRRRSSPRQH